MEFESVARVGSCDFEESALRRPTIFLVPPNPCPIRAETRSPVMVNDSNMHVQTDGHGVGVRLMRLPSASSDVDHTA